MDLISFYFYIFLILNYLNIHGKSLKSNGEGARTLTSVLVMSTRKGPIMKKTPEREKERVYTCKTVCVADRREKNGGKNGKWQAGKWEGTCPQPSSQSLVFSSIDNPTPSRCTSLSLNFLSLLALLSHFSFIFSLLSLLASVLHASSHGFLSAV